MAPLSQMQYREPPADIIAGGSDKTSDLHVPVPDIVLRALRYNRKGDNNG
jgi:hypothetical protein